MDHLAGDQRGNQRPLRGAQSTVEGGGGRGGDEVQSVLPQVWQTSSHPAGAFPVSSGHEKDFKMNRWILFVHQASI